MSERGVNYAHVVEVWVYIVLIVILIFVTDRNQQSDINALQHRIGELEQKVR